MIMLLLKSLASLQVGDCCDVEPNHTPRLIFFPLYLVWHPPSLLLWGFEGSAPKTGSTGRAPSALHVTLLGGVEGQCPHRGFRAKIDFIIVKGIDFYFFLLDDLFYP